MTKKKQYKPKRKSSGDKAKWMVENMDYNTAMAEAKNSLKNARSCVDEVYWRSVIYKIKQTNKAVNKC